MGARSTLWRRAGRVAGAGLGAAALGASLALPVRAQSAPAPSVPAAPAASAALAAMAGAPAARAPSTAQLARGAEIFGGVCFACHGAQGQGTVGIAPALAGTLAPALATAEGRGYVLRVLMHGLSGRIVSQGQTFMGAMPAQSNFHDEDLAALGAHLAKLNGSEAVPFSAADVAAARAEKPAPSHKALRELRAKVLP